MSKLKNIPGSFSLSLSQPNQVCFRSCSFPNGCFVGEPAVNLPGCTRCCKFKLALVCVKSLSNVSTTAGMAFDFGKEKDTVPGRSPGVGK